MAESININIQDSNSPEQGSSTEPYDDVEPDPTGGTIGGVQPGDPNYYGEEGKEALDQLKEDAITARQILDYRNAYLPDLQEAWDGVLGESYDEWEDYLTGKRKDVPTSYFEGLIDVKNNMTEEQYNEMLRKLRSYELHSYD